MNFVALKGDISEFIGVATNSSFAVSCSKLVYSRLNLWSNSYADPSPVSHMQVANTALHLFQIVYVFVYLLKRNLSLIT